MCKRALTGPADHNWSTDISFVFVHANGKSLYIVDWRMLVVEGGNVLHHVKSEGNCLGGVISGGICPREMSSYWKLHCSTPLAKIQYRPLQLSYEYSWKYSSLRRRTQSETVSSSSSSSSCMLWVCLRCSRLWWFFFHQFSSLFVASACSCDCQSVIKI